MTPFDHHHTRHRQLGPLGGFSHGAIAAPKRAHAAAVEETQSRIAHRSDNGPMRATPKQADNGNAIR
jgi:hypothetical protein